jgi:hypothetical protein
MEGFIKIGQARVNASKLLLVEPERVLNTGEETGYAKLTFEGGVERVVPIYGQTVDEILESLIADD